MRGTEHYHWANQKTQHRNVETEWRLLLLRVEFHIIASSTMPSIEALKTMGAYTHSTSTGSTLSRTTFVVINSRERDHLPFFSILFGAVGAHLSGQPLNYQLTEGKSRLFAPKQSTPPICILGINWLGKKTVRMIVSVLSNDAYLFSDKNTIVIHKDVWMRRGWRWASEDRYGSSIEFALLRSIREKTRR